MSGRRNRINKRSEKKEQDQRIRDSLAESSTPVVTFPNEEDNTPLDLSPVRENLVTAAASKSIDRQQESSDSSDNSELEGVKLNPTTVKKSAKATSPLLESIPFNINMSVFDTELTYIVDVWLGALSANAEIRLMLVDNQIFTYDDYKQLDKESVYLLDRVTSNGATTRLKNHHAKRVTMRLSGYLFLRKLERQHKVTIRQNGLREILRNGKGKVCQPV